MEGFYISIFQDGSYRVLATLNNFHHGPQLHFYSDGNIKSRAMKTANREVDEEHKNNAANGQVELFKVYQIANSMMEHGFDANGTPTKSDFFKQ